MELIIAAIALFLFIAIWWVIAKKLKPKHGFIIRHLLGSTFGFLAMIIVIIIAAPKVEKENTDIATSQQVTSDEKETTPESTKPTEVAETESKNVQPVETAEPIEEPKEIVEVADLDTTPTLFLNDLDFSLKQVELPIKINITPNIKKGNVNDSMTVALNEYLNIAVTISKHTGNVMSVTLIGMGDGTPESGVNMMAAAIATFMAASGEITDEHAEKHAKLVMGMIQELDTDSDEDTVKHNTDRFHYTIQKSPMLGVWFIVEPNK